MFAACNTTQFTEDGLSLIREGISLFVVPGNSLQELSFSADLRTSRNRSQVFSPGKSL